MDGAISPRMPQSWEEGPDLVANLDEQGQLAAQLHMQLPANAIENPLYPLPAQLRVPVANSPIVIGRVPLAELPAVIGDALLRIGIASE
jgi:hypothetical protein